MTRASTTASNRTSFPWVEALRAAKKPVNFYLYDGVNHAFNNDTSAERYNKAAADLAWKRTLAFFKQASAPKKRAGGSLHRPFPSFIRKASRMKLPPSGSAR